MLGGNVFRWALEKVTEKISEKLLEHSGYATSWIGMSSWKGNWTQKKQNETKLGVISRSTSCQITILLLCFNDPFSFVRCNLSMWGITGLQGTVWLGYNSVYWVYLFLQFWTYAYNRSKESAEWQAAIVLLKDNEDKVAVFQMKVFSYNCICSTFLNPLAWKTLPITSESQKGALRSIFIH